MKNKQKKYLFFDVDNTLVPNGKKMPASTIKALKLLQSNGNEIFVVSGRAHNNIHNFVLEFGFDGIISGCGTRIQYNNIDLFYHPLSTWEHKTTLNVLKEKNIAYVVQTNKNLIAKPFYFNRFYNKKISIKEVLQSKDYEGFIETFGEVLYGNADNSYKYDNTESIWYFLSDIPSKELSSYLPDTLRAISWGKNSTLDRGEICSSIYTKGWAINFLIENLKINRKETIAFGDSLNDVDMISTSYTGIAMGNACPELKKTADYVTDDCTNDGIYNALKKLDLI